jgi:hypothetical protein
MYSGGMVQLLATENSKTKREPFSTNKLEGSLFLVQKTFVTPQKMPLFFLIIRNKRKTIRRER